MTADMSARRFLAIAVPALAAAAILLIAAEALDAPELAVAGVGAVFAAAVAGQAWSGGLRFTAALLLAVVAVGFAAQLVLG